MKVLSEPARVRGFRFAGVSAGLKTVAGAKDLGLIAAQNPIAAAGLFTTNRVKAAPVVVASERVGRGKLQAVVVNSGSANCFTGKPGLRLALDSCAAVAAELGCDGTHVAPCSTGVIGHLYDFEKYRDGVRRAVGALNEDGLEEFARAIMTTDTRPKAASVRLRLGGREITVAGAAKGSGMLSPRVATMLAFIVTDVAVTPAQLRTALKEASASSFNAITVDGDMSTNDTVLAMASGAAENRALDGRERAIFVEAIGAVASSLARQLVYDGEGATKLVAIRVRGARSRADAERIARRIGNSPLVKTAFFGCDPNVGRIIAAAGASGVALDPARLELRVGGVKIASRGMLLVGALEAAQQRMREREFAVDLNLKLGSGEAALLTSDLSLDYVKINAEYTT
jgi:glutamate N-acetyltransferase/amino-acid N-acetyltransferase